MKEAYLAKFQNILVNIMVFDSGSSSRRHFRWLLSVNFGVLEVKHPYSRTNQSLSRILSGLMVYMYRLSKAICMLTFIKCRPKWDLIMAIVILLSGVKANFLSLTILKVRTRLLQHSLCMLH